MKAKTLNDGTGTLNGFDCPVCKNKGYVAYVKDGIVRTAECECMVRRRNAKRIKKSGLSDLVEAYTFARYEAPEKWQANVKEIAMRYIEDGEGKWFVMAGTPGTGKTHICTAISGELMNAGKDVRYMLWRDEAPRLKAMVNDREGYEQAMDNYKRVDVLYIDDFFKGGVTEADINLAFELLNARYNAQRKKTIISTEKSIEQLLDIDEAIGSRIYERSKGFYIKTPNKNWRLR